MGVPDSMLDDSPWGDAYQMYEYSQGEGEYNFGLNAGTLAKMVGADELLTFEIDGVEQLPEPGIQLYCVDCGVTGKMTTRGTATFTLLVGFTDLELALNGDIHATLQLGLNAYAEWEHELGSARIFKVPIGGFSIPEVIDVGPMLTMDVDATIGVKALGQVLAGAKLDWDRIGATINFFDMSKSEAHGFLPYITPVFNVSGQITAEASIGLPIGIAIGIDILDGLWEEEVALVDRPALAFSATYSASYNTEDGGSTGQDGCDGISWGVQFENSLELELPVLGKFDIGSWESGNFLEGCVGDNGVSMVQQQEQPVPAGQTRAGCTIYSQLVQNPGFDVLDANGYATPWTYSKNYDELQVFLRRDSVTSSQPFSLGIYIESGGDQNKVYSMTFYAPFTACTANNYDINFKMRQNYGNGICTLVSVGVFSYSNPLLNVLQDPQTVLPIHADHMDSYGPYSFAVPAYNNHAQETLYTGVTVECELSTQFEVLLDDFTITPWFFNKEKRDLDQRSDEVTMQPGGSPQYWKRDDSVDYHPFQVKPTKTSDSPASPEGYEAPIITPSFIAPPLSATTYDSASVLPNYEAPAVSANWVAPVITAVATTKLVGSYPPNADPTAVATRIGDSTYDFEPFSDIMASAKLGAIGSLPTDAATTEASNGYTNLRDLTATVQMASANDGNIYLTGYPSGSAGTKFLSKQSVIVKDEGDRLLHYYPDTMTTYGVSRIRAASIEESPLTSQLLTLIPLNTGDSGTVYAASDTVGNIFLLAFCTSTSWPGSKVFLVKDYDASLTELQSSEVQWVVTGAQVDTCAPLLVTSNAVPLA